MENTPLPTLVEKINESLNDGNRAVLHQESIRFIVDERQDKIVKLMEYMDLIEDLTGESANQYQFDIVYPYE